MLAQLSRPPATINEADNPSYQLRAALAQRLAAHRQVAREGMMNAGMQASACMAPAAIPVASPAPQRLQPR
jgi:hypothetical protein